jgi:hypothetical protein
MTALLLRDRAVGQLRNDVHANLSRYREENFDFLTEDSQWRFETDIELDENEVSAIRTPTADENFDAYNCAAMLRIFPKLTPYQGGDERLWTYMAHTLLLKYGRARWPIPTDDEKAIGHIRKHFFASAQRQLERDNLASRLWWMGHLCKRAPSINIEKALEVLLFRSDVRANVIERPTVSQSIPVFTAILRKLLASYEGDKHLFERRLFRRIMIALNGKGGFKLLDVLNAAQIDNLLNDIISERTA